MLNILRFYEPHDDTKLSITNENVEDYLFYSNVDEYSVYEYLALGE